MNITENSLSVAYMRLRLHLADIKSGRIPALAVWERVVDEHETASEDEPATEIHTATFLVKEGVRQFMEGNQ